MPLENQAVDIPQRAEHALTKKTLVKDWGIKPWEFGKLSVKDMQDVGLAEHAEAYIQQEQYNQNSNQMRSSRNSESYQDWQNNMQEKYGGFQ